MYLFIIFLFAGLFVSGAAIWLVSVGKYTSYAETEGEVLDYLNCNPGPEVESGGEEKESAVVISYSVGGKAYTLATNIKSQGKAGTPSRVKVLYDPYFPGKSRLKEGTPFLGVALIVASIIGLTMLLTFF